MGLGGADDDEKVKLLIAYLRKMNDELKIPHCIKNYGADSYPTENGFGNETVFCRIAVCAVVLDAVRNLQFVIHLTQISDEELYLFVVICTAKTHKVSDYAVTLLELFRPLR